MNRRDVLKQTGAALLALGAAPFPLAWTAPADQKRRRILMYTRSEGFEHSVVRRPARNKLSLAERIVTELGAKNGFEVICEKDGRVFLSKDFPTFDGFVFETQGNLLSEKCKDGSPPMQPEGKQALLKAVATGKGFVGCHCASDTFHSPGPREQNQAPSKIDPYIAMLGGEFIRHGSQQKAWMRITDDQFPGAEGLKDFQLLEEWYALKNFAKDLHVILVQDTEGMKKTGGDRDYDRPNFPATWARLHQKGRVFYTSMGHREDVWQNKTFQRLLLGAINWSLGNAEAKLTPNLDQVAPKARELPALGKKK
jgi:type 1 glutamine amidotransferase